MISKGVVVAIAAFGVISIAACSGDDTSTTSLPVDDVTTTSSGDDGVDTTTTGAVPDTTGAPVVPPTGEAQEFRVVVDNGVGSAYPASFNVFAPTELQVRPGDEIVFEMPLYQGEPHNVAVGQIVNGAADAYRALPPGTLVFPGGRLPDVPDDLADAAEKLPPALPPNLEPTEAAMAKLAPCWLDDDAPPLDGPCDPADRNVDRPFTGTEQYVMSKVLIESGDEFRLQLSPEIAGGTYSFLCTLHPTSMHGSFEVVGGDVEIADPQDVAEQAAVELAAITDEYRSVVEELASQTGEPTDDGIEVQAGEVAGGIVPPYSLNIFPSLLTVDRGDTVTWRIHGAHMFTFNPPGGVAEFVTLERGDDDIVRPTADNLEDPGPGQPGMPPGFTLDPVTVDGGAFNGTDYLHSGLLYGRIGPLPAARYTLTFNELGNYVYYCLRHPGMVGTVEVRE